MRVHEFTIVPHYPSYSHPSVTDLAKPDLVGYTLFFFIRTSNFDAEAERSYIFWRFEAETFLKMFLNLPGIVFQPIGLITVYDAILTGRQSGQKLQRLYGNPIANNFFQN